LAVAIKHGFFYVFQHIWILWPALEAIAAWAFIIFLFFFGFGIAGNYELSEKPNAKCRAGFEQSGERKSARNNCKLLSVCIKLNENCSTPVAP